MNKEDLINSYLRRTIDIKQFQFLTGLKRSQSFRIIAQYKKYGFLSLAHGLTGKPGNSCSNEFKNLKDAAIRTYKKELIEFGPTLAAEYLEKYHDIKIDHDTLRRELIKRKLWISRKRKRKIIRIRRTPKDSFGEMIQYDGSYHKWFGNKEYCLLLAVDDATSKLVKAEFCTGEGVKDTLNFWKEYVRKYGKPEKIYLDKFSTYKQNNSDDPRDLTTFQSICRELEISLVYANSPQAKGRVERRFGNLQDRLIKHLAYLGIKTFQEAQLELHNFIEDFNQRFSRKSVIQADKHMKMGLEDLVRIDSIFSEKFNRKINNDFTVSFQGRILQIQPMDKYAFKRHETVRVEVRTDESVYLYSPARKIYLDYRQVAERPKENELLIVLKPKAVPRSPWRQTNSIFFKRKVNSITKLINY